MNISGSVDDRFSLVRSEFENNFLHRGKLGGACAVYYRGEKVVDLWGGYCDPSSENHWEENALVCVFSATKGMTSAALVMAHSCGWFELDKPEVKCWPECAQRGKQNITVRQLLSHQAGLSEIDEPLTPRKLTDLSYANFSASTILYDGGTVLQHGFDAANLETYPKTSPVPEKSPAI